MTWAPLLSLPHENTRTHTACSLGHFPCRYEEEINKRTTAENEFVVLKKVRRGWVSLSHRGSGEWRVGGGDIREETEACAPYRGAWS